MTIAMTPRRFLRKSTSAKVSADAFLASHREWLETGELAQFTSPLLAKLDSKELLPTPCLNEINNLVLAHMLGQDIAKGEAQMDKAARTGEGKPYLSTVYDSKGNICTRINDEGNEVELVQDFERLSDAANYADRKLFDGAPDWFAVIQHLKLIDKETNEPMATIVMRDEAIARVLRGKAGAVMHRNRSSSALTWKPKVKESRCHFSHG